MKKYVFFAVSLLSSIARAQLPDADQRILEHMQAGKTVLLVIGDIRAKELDNLYRVFPEKLRAEVLAHPEKKREITFRRYGWPINPDTGMPYAFTKVGRNEWRANCLICHGGNVPDPSGKPFFRAGMPNREVELRNFFDDRMAMVEKFPQYVDQKLIRSPAYRTFEAAFAKQPLSLNRGLINVWGTFGYESGLRTLDLRLDLDRLAKLLLGNGYNFGMEACDVDPPSWWGTRFRKYFYPDAFAPNDPRVMLQIVNWPGNPVKKWLPWMTDVMAEFKHLTPPKFKGALDPAKAKRGEGVFADHCAGCHGTYTDNGEVDFPNKVIPIEKIGTDDLRLRVGVTREYREYVRDSWLGSYGKSPVVVEPTGYQAPVLRGVWATAPYFHNGAVPTVYHVLRSTERPKTWQADLAKYDFEKLGLTFTSDVVRAAQTTEEEKRTVFDSSLPGKSVSGHTYGDKLSAAELDEVIEYLKTL